MASIGLPKVGKGVVIVVDGADREVELVSAEAARLALGAARPTALLRTTVSLADNEVDGKESRRIASKAEAQVGLEKEESEDDDAPGVVTLKGYSVTKDPEQAGARGKQNSEGVAGDRDGRRSLG